MKINKLIFIFIITTSALLICWNVSDNSDEKGEYAVRKDYIVVLSGQKEEMPTPLAEDENPGFKWRGIKGWGWDAEQYLAEIPVLAKYKMNFLMNCYLSMYDVKNKDIETSMFGTSHPDLDKWGNNWWQPLDKEKKEAYEKVVKTCQAYNINFCFSMNPNLFSHRPLKYDNEKDFNDLWQHYEWIQSLGVKWFCICFDDIGEGVDASVQARFVNKLLEKLRKNDTSANLILTPTHYRGTGDNDEYLTTLAKEMHKDVYVFWAGMSATATEMKRETLESYKKNVGHRVFIWDNYPANDARYVLNLGPVTGRDATLCEVAEGFMANSMCWQNEINRLPVITIADYTYNPANYNPDKSIGQAILHLGETKEQQQALKELVELYPGSLLYNKGIRFNPLIYNFEAVLNKPDGQKQGKEYIHYIEGAAGYFNKTFPDKYKATKETLENNINKMKELFKEKYGTAN